MLHLFALQLHAPLFALQAASFTISSGTAAIISLLVSLLLPYASGFFTAELAKFWSWVQAQGVVLGNIIGAVVAGLGAAGMAWLQVHIPGLTHWIPADLHNLSGEAIVGLLIGLVNFILHVPVALKTLRLKRGGAYKI